MQDLRSQFLLKSRLTFLNFGSFGACPKPIFERYQQYQRELEEDPVHFQTVSGLEYLAASRKALAGYIGCDADDVVFFPNPSHAVNAVAKSFPLQPGDEVLATDIEYGACDRTWQFYCDKAGAVYKRQPIVFPLQSREDFVEQFAKGFTEKTKLVFISGITSSTGLRLPVEDVCRLAKAKGLPVFVDGAHVPGHIPLNIEDLGADYYTGACHKWMMTPKGSSFLVVKKERQAGVEPLVVSWGYNALFPSPSTFQDYHTVQGTRDFSAFLTIPAALAFMQAHDWPALASHFRQMTQANAAPFCQLLGATPLAPVTDDFIAQLYSAEIKTTEPETLHDHLYQHYHIQVPVMRQNGKVYLRYSLNAFNTQADLDRLFDAVADIRRKTTLIEN